MKVIITESQYDRLLMEVSVDNLQQVSNYITRAVRKRYPVVSEISIIHSPYNNTRSDNKVTSNIVDVTIFVDEILPRFLGRGNYRREGVDERDVMDYTVKLIKNFMGLIPSRISFDSESFLYPEGNYIAAR